MNADANPRVTAVNGASVQPDHDFVLYWMVAFRRTSWNHSLERAVRWSQELGKPLVILEALRCDYPWASDRLHKFVLDGMADNSRQLGRSSVHYHPYVEPRPGAGRGLLNALARRACVVVTDDFPAFFIPRMIEAAGRSLPARLEKVDSNGLIPIRSSDTEFSSAHHFRRYAHDVLLMHLGDFPRQNPLARTSLPQIHSLPTEIAERWPAADVETLTRSPDPMQELPVDHVVKPTSQHGGERAARRVLRRFLSDRLESYGELRNHPEAEATSGLSPYLHFGHMSTFEIVHRLLELCDWTPDAVNPTARGRRSGWWGLDANAESFLDELVTWRELGYHACAHQADYDQYESLPDWARQTLAEHSNDLRTNVYSLAEFEEAQTHDPLWNAAQRQLVREGDIHGYLRMLWGKKILEWSPTPQEALANMIELNNKYALDGRNPNSYSGIFWVLGRYDRPWAPERPIFGRIRYMSSENTARKFKVRNYIQRYAVSGNHQLDILNR